jgi:acyl carrier protein
MGKPKPIARSKLYDDVCRIITEHLAVDEQEITLEAKFVEDLGADSLDAIEIVMVCEEQFHVEFDDEQAEKLKTVGELVAHIEQLTAAR